MKRLSPRSIVPEQAESHRSDMVLFAAAEMEEKLASTGLQLAKVQAVCGDEKKALRKAMSGNENAQNQSQDAR